MKSFVRPAALFAGVLCFGAFGFEANAATVTIGSQTYTGDAPFEFPVAPDSQSGQFTTTTGSILNVTLSPWASNSNYVSTAQSWTYDVLSYGSQGAGTATYNLTGASSFTILWGSPDSYNHVKFYDSSSNLIQEWSGNNLACYGTTCKQTLYDLVSFNLSSIAYVIVSDDGTAAFEYAIPAIQHSSTTPLPAALPLFASGLGALGLLGWRRKRKAAAAIAA